MLLMVHLKNPITKMLILMLMLLLLLKKLHQLAKHQLAKTIKHPQKHPTNYPLRVRPPLRKPLDPRPFTRFRRPDTLLNTGRLYNAFNDFGCIVDASGSS